ncbi:MAG: single-stranded DNA-binding protein [Candidatus Obscuribacterales bacterium]|nr:single-stranded DNA-binding protein [Candidatus Obscuribacterales bacterium]
MKNNTVMLVGRVGADAQQVTFEKSENRLAKFSIAVKQTKDETMWIDVEAWNEQAEQVLSYFTKGREVIVHGRLALNSYVNKDGQQVTKPLVKLTDFYLCGTKPKSDEGESAT